MRQHHTNPGQLLAIREQRSRSNNTTILLDAETPKRFQIHHAFPILRRLVPTGPGTEFTDTGNVSFPEKSHSADRLARSHALPCFRRAPSMFRTSGRSIFESMP